MRRERGDSHNKSGIVFFPTNKKHVGFKRVLKKFAIYL